MDWHLLYSADRKPWFEDIEKYIANPLWASFVSFVEQAYGSAPLIEYSRCGGAPGWNVKYRARSRALCTVYPREGFFTCMVSVGSKEKDEAEALLPACDPSVQQLYQRSADSSMGRWLMIDVTSEAVLRDAEAFMQLRVSAKKVVE